MKGILNFDFEFNFNLNRTYIRNLIEDVAQCGSCGEKVKINKVILDI